MVESFKKWLKVIVSGSYLSPGIALAGEPPTGTTWGDLFTQDKILPTANPTDQLADIVGYIIQWLLWIAGALVVVYLIYGGIIYIASAGNAERATAGKNAIIQAVIGIVIILLSYVIVTWVRGILTD